MGLSASSCVIAIVSGQTGWPLPASPFGCPCSSTAPAPHSARSGCTRSFHAAPLLPRRRLLHRALLLTRRASHRPQREFPRQEERKNVLVGIVEMLASL